MKKGWNCGFPVGHSVPCGRSTGPAEDSTVRPHPRTMLCLRLCVLGLAGTAASLVPPMRGHGGQEVVECSSRRDVLSAASASPARCAPLPSHASYALYQASYDSYGEREATGYVPVATSDKATLSAIQNDIQRKRPQSALKAKKPPQYCAVRRLLSHPCLRMSVRTSACPRRTSRTRWWIAVRPRPCRACLTQPRLSQVRAPRRSHACSQSHACALCCADGNMNVGAFNGLSGRDAYEADARQAYVRQAATAARQRSESARKKAN